MKEMHIQSVNIGLPKEVEWRGETVVTGIFKNPVDTAVQVKQQHLAGDGQGDLIHHGGENKAVYVYASEHYPYWNNLLNQTVTPGSFGENITSHGLLDAEVCIGDTYLFGTAILMAIQPRIPCFKLGIRFNNPIMTKQFFNARRNGIYFKVLEQGMVQKGDRIELVQQSAYNITIQHIVDCYVLKEKNLDDIKILSELTLLPTKLRSDFASML